MAYEQRDNSGSLFKNKDKEEGDNRPDYQGEAMIDGVMFRMSAWIKRKDGKPPFMSFSFQTKDDRR